MGAFKGLEPGSHVTPPTHPELGAAEHVYEYVTEVGAPLFYVCRFTTETGKDFRQGHPSGTNGATWKWSLAGVEPVLYRADEIADHLEAGRVDPIYVCEGEKDADNCRAQMLVEGVQGVATTSPMGAGKWRPWYTEALTGARHVVVVVDNDDPGKLHGRAIRAELAPVVDRLQLLRPALDHEHADLTDHLEAGLRLSELIPLEDPIEASPADLAVGPVFMHWRDFINVEEEPRPPLWGTEEHVLLAEAGFAIFAGRPGVGKTTFTVDLIAHLAAGLPYPPVDPENSHAPEPYPVARPLKIALIENEGPMRLFRDKLRRKMESFPHDLDELGGWLGIQTFRWGAFSFADADAFLRAGEELEEHNVDLVVGDPLGMLGVEGVGSPDKTGMFVARLRELGLGTTRAFLLIHHFRQRRDAEDDELSALSGAWSQHLDSLITLAQGSRESEVRLAFPKLRWSTSELPKPLTLGKVWARAGFEALGLEDDLALLEPELVAGLEELRREGGGTQGWITYTGLALKVGRGKEDVRKVLENGEHLFVMRTGDEAKELGARNKSTKLWGLRRWLDEELEAGEPELGEDGEREEALEVDPRDADELGWR